MALAGTAANSYEWPIMQAKGMYFEYLTANLRLKYKPARRRRFRVAYFRSSCSRAFGAPEGA